jgi:hypothetical protein
MPPIISEIVKITVDRAFTLDSPAFARLRKSVVQGGVKEQYYGIDTDEPTNLFWVIRTSVVLRVIHMSNGLNSLNRMARGY